MVVAEIFERVDKKNGKISWDEFAEAIHAFSPFITSEELDNMFIELDVDGDNPFDAAEFASCLMIGGEGEKDDDNTFMTKTFDFYDINGDEKIYASEIHVVLKHLREKHTMEEFVVMVRAVDVDSDDIVSFEKFKTMMSSNNV